MLSYFRCNWSEPLNGFRAYKLNGKCITEVTSGEPFNYMQAHISWGTQMVAAVLTEQTGTCNSRWSKKPTFGGNTAYRYGPSNNSASTPVTNTLPADMYFRTADLTQFSNSKQLLYPPQPFYTTTLSGPRYSRSHCTVPLRKIKYGNSLLDSADAVYWTDWVEDPDQTDIGTDWLGKLLPGTYCMAPTSYAANPFKAEKYWEDSGTNFNPTEWAKTQFMYAPWCTPLNIYSSANVKTGSVLGTGFMVFFAPACVKNPRKPVNDPTSELNPPPKLDTALQYWSIELWTYLICSGVRSPRIATQRWWYFSQTGPTPNADTRSPHTPYWFLRCAMNNFYVRFNTVEGTTKDYLFPFANGEVAIVA